MNVSLQDVREALGELGKPPRLLRPSVRPIFASAFFSVFNGKTPSGSNRLRLRSCPRRHRS